MSKKMLIDARHPEETRVALLSGGKVEDFDFESLSRRPLRGNIYLARVTRVEPSLQAAFVEYGGNRHGFLAFGEIHSDYYQIPVADRDILRAAEELEAELAAKLAEYDDRGIDLPDDDDRDGDEPDQASSDNGEARADEDESPSRSRRGRRRRGRGRRGRGGNKSETKAEANAENASDEASDIVVETIGEETIIENGDSYISLSDEAPTASVQDLDETEPFVEEESVPQDELDAGAEDTPVTEHVENDEDEDPEGPTSIGLSAKVEPQLTEEIASTAHENDHAEASADTLDETAKTSATALEVEPAPAPDDANNPDVAAQPEEITAEAPLDAEDAPEENDESNDDQSEASARGSEDDDTGDTEEGDLPTDNDEEEAVEADAKPALTPEEEAAARKEAEDLAELQQRYNEARRERDRLLRNYRIQEVIKRRQIMLVQVVKEERGNKGAALTSYLSLAGRYGVLMPNNSRGGGVSRKISNQSDRRRLRKAIADLSVPKGQSLIIRTAGAKRTKAEIRRDYDYLSRLWDTIRAQTMESVAPCLIYEEASLIKRAIRDLYDKDTSEVLVEGDEGYREAKDFMKMLMPSHAKNVQPYRELEPLFLRHSVEKQLDEMYQPVVQLKSGGYLVIQQTEALISVDVNSGKATKERNVEATALKTNTEAAQELARQCRLRDLAGLIVVDFIDMDENRNNRAVEKKFKEALKSDRARIQTGSISSFGLLEMSRQRRRSGIVDGTMRVCPSCDGSGFVRSVEMAALRILRAVEEKAVLDRAAQVTSTTAADVALYILNQKRSWLNRMEDSYGVTIEIIADSAKIGDQYDVKTSGQARDIDSLRQPAPVDPTDIDPDDLQDADQADDSDVAESDAETTARDDESDDKPKRKRRRRRRRKGDGDDQAEAEGHSEAEDADAKASDDDKDEQAETDEDDEPKKKRRRGRRGGRGRGRKEEAASEENAESSDEITTDTSAPAQEDPADSSASSESAELDVPISAPEVETDAPAPEVVAEDITETSEAAPEKEDATSQEEPARTAASLHAPVDPEAKAAPNDDKPKRGGWWQRAFNRD